MMQFAAILILTVLSVIPLVGQAPEGWQVRIDRSTSAADPDDVPNVKVTTVGKGFRVTGGPAGTYWNATHRAKGNFTARGTFRLMKPSGHTNYYGTGENTQDVTRMMHSAVRRPGTDGASTNTLEVRVAGDQISYVVNGTVVHTTPKSGATAQTDGIVGVRVNHLLDVQVEEFSVS
jgi:hypothetical protein